MRTRRPHRCRLWVEELENRLVPAALTFSTNWSGYAVLGGGGAINSVAGSWNVPAVASGYGYSATWVGIDGFNSNRVEQIGTESDYVNGQATYYAWYEMYPMPTVPISQPIQPGDTISASVAYAAGKGFTLTINDSSWSSPFTKTIQTTAPRTSAEWVVEAPAMGNQVVPLANFGTETFSGASATVGSTTGSIRAVSAVAPVKQVDMIGTAGTLKDVTSALNPAGTGFTVTFNPNSTSRIGSLHTQVSFGNTTREALVQGTTTFLIVILPTGPAFTPPLLSFEPLPPRPQTAPPPQVTVTAQPPIAPPTLLDPFYGTPGVSDVLPAADMNLPGGVVPGGPAAPPGQNGRALPAGPQLRPEGLATPPATSMVLPEGNEGAALVQDATTASQEPADDVDRTVEVAGVVLTLALSGSCGISLGERTARVKPGDAEEISLRVR
jgi:hypothetical protein